MIGWRFWVLLAVAAVFGLWATSSLVLLEDEAPVLQVDGGAGDFEQIRPESRQALRDILREADSAEDSSR
jgi:hypothetical protein